MSFDINAVSSNSYPQEVTRVDSETSVQPNKQQEIDKMKKTVEELNEKLLNYSAEKIDAEIRLKSLEGDHSEKAELLKNALIKKIATLDINIENLESYKARLLDMIKALESSDAPVNSGEVQTLVDSAQAGSEQITEAKRSERSSLRRLRNTG